MESSFSPDEPTPMPRSVTYRCSCGGNVQIQVGGEGVCETCGRTVDLRGGDTTHTVSFCAEVGSGTSFHLADGPDRTGEVLGHFRLLAKLGYGGMGAVYRAQDESLQRLVAVKVMRSAQEGGEGDGAKQVARLLDEAVSQAKLNHPNVVTIYYVGRVGEEPFLAMELLPGPTLGALIANGPLPFGEVIHYAQQVVAALKHASVHGLVHGDIKPSNLILTGDKTVKLSDFGLAKTEQTSPKNGVSGTLSYIAPELVIGGDPSDQSDMYSLGVTLFELSFGRRPYAIVGSTLREQLRSQRRAQIAFPEKWPNSVPEQWREVIAKLTAREPAERYANYVELAHVLDDLAPVGVTNAGLLNRSMAYLVDLAFWGLFLLLLSLAALFTPQIVEQIEILSRQDETLAYYIHLLTQRLARLGLLAPLVPLVATWMEWRGWRTVGRYLFQLRVVDTHGLLIRPRTRLFRSLFRYVPLWVSSFTVFAMACGLDLVAVILAPLDEIIILLNLILVLGPSRMALHDRLFRTHVVLDTKIDRRQ